MSRYKCTIERSMYSAWVEGELHLDPENYLYCDDDIDLYNAVQEELYDACNTGDVIWKDSDCDFDIPKDFIDEWKSLKGLK